MEKCLSCGCKILHTVGTTTYDVLPNGSTVSKSRIDGYKCKGCGIFFPERSYLGSSFVEQTSVEMRHKE